MYVCVCHAIRCSDIEKATCQGVCRPQEVHGHFGVKPRCGRCLPTIRQMLKTVEAGAPKADG